MGYSQSMDYKNGNNTLGANVGYANAVVHRELWKNF